MRRHFWAQAAVVVAFTVVPSGLVWADGYEFFGIDRGRQVKLAYVGQIREKGSGRIVREPAYFMVTDKRSGMTFPFVNDRPGHYRSPDIGESVEELAAAEVNPKDLEFEVVIDGYKKATISGGPRKNHGVVEVNFKVEREDANGSAGGETANTATQPASTAPSSGDGAGSGGAQGGDPAGAGSRSIRLIFMAVTGVMIIAGAAARTSGLRQSTGR